MGTRRCDFAGQWYPGSREECLGMLKGFEREMTTRADLPDAASVRGLIVPHAGWFYSGLTAWSAMSAAASDTVELIVIFGNHLSYRESPTLLDCDAWETPVRTAEISPEDVSRLAGVAEWEVETAVRHRRDNGIELVLAMAVAAWPNARIVCIGIPPTKSAITIGLACGEMLGTGRVLYIGSTDLTHYGPSYGFVPKGTGASALQWSHHENDAAFVDRLVHADAEGALASAAQRQNACCPGAAAAAIAAAHASRGLVTDTRTSAFRAKGSPVDFVGYAGVLLLGSG